MISKIYSQNVHKNRRWTQQLLETLHDSIDIIMIQEPPRYHVKNIPTGDSAEGAPEMDTCHDSRWSKIFFHSNVSVYINEKLLKTHSLFLFPSVDNNIIAFTLHHLETDEKFNFINCYNDNEQETLRRLLSFLEHENLDHLTLLGDFNLHSPLWDINILTPSTKATALADRAATAGLLLLNESDRPTWTQPGKDPSVLDLVFVHMDLLENFTPTVKIDLEGRGTGDHASITLTFDAPPTTPALKRALPSNSKNYSRFILEATEILSNIGNADVETVCQRIADAFESHSIIIQEKPKPSWWTQTCSDAKFNYRTTRSEEDKARFYKAMKHARNTFFTSKINEAAGASLSGSSQGPPPSISSWLTLKAPPYEIITRYLTPSMVTLTTKPLRKCNILPL